jgi:palmitoyltransferase
MTPFELLLGLVLTGTQSHYEFRGVVDEKRLEHLLLAGKQILYKSHQESDVRYVKQGRVQECCMRPGL